jgi:lipopolysaccharide transport system ATP-binding protein
VANGLVQSTGKIADVVNEYTIRDSVASVYQPKIVKRDLPISFEKIKVCNEKSEPCANFTVYDPILLVFDLLVNEKDSAYSLFVIIKNIYGNPVFSAEIKIGNQTQYKLKIGSKFLTRGTYSIHTFIHIPGIVQIDVAADICNFFISDTSSELAVHGNYEYGNVFGNYSWI